MGKIISALIVESQVKEIISADGLAAETRSKIKILCNNGILSNLLIKVILHKIDKKKIISHLTYCNMIPIILPVRVHRN